MASPILVGYSTHAGSTQEVAETVAEVLRAAGLEVDLQPVKSVRSLDAYSAFVLGAPLYMFHWHQPMRAFVSRQRKALEARPVAVFALGPFHNKEDELKGAREMLGKELAKFAWLKPVAVETFVGKFDPAALRFPYNLIPAMKQMPPSDERDWDVIRAWAGSLPTLLGAA